ncbi:MAG: transcriptional repressor NrdR [Dehalococcoidia bacterium]|nr:transcriptional repressor NrdR [Dehalococcoidia bacterium]
MRCPQCAHPHSKVTDSRESNEGIRRRRECLLCGHRFTTMEHCQSPTLIVLKRDGRREDFSREKVTSGILRACARRPVTMEAIDKLVEGIERDLNRSGKPEVPSSSIGQMVMERLRGLDRVAYVRFASVYRNYQDVESFVQEAQELLGNEQAPEPVATGKRNAAPQLPNAQLPLPMAGSTGRGRRSKKMAESA